MSKHLLFKHFDGTIHTVNIEADATNADVYKQLRSHVKCPHPKWLNRGKPVPDNDSLIDIVTLSRDSGIAGHVFCGKPAASLPERMDTVLYMVRTEAGDIIDRGELDVPYPYTNTGIHKAVANLIPHKIDTIWVNDGSIVYNSDADPLVTQHIGELTIDIANKKTLGGKKTHRRRSVKRSVKRSPRRASKRKSKSRGGSRR